MSGENKVLERPAVKSAGNENVKFGSTKTPCLKPGMVLDMGEASREEGFRLNGCR